MIYKSCGRCGKLHPKGYICTIGKEYKGGIERQLRSKYSWAMKSQEIRERANYLCEVCRDNGVYTYDGLEVHHIIKLKDDPSKLLDNDNLVCLCTEHHKMADNGEIETDYLRKLVEIREGKDTPPPK